MKAANDDKRLTTLQTDCLCHNVPRKLTDKYTVT